MVHICQPQGAHVIACCELFRLAQLLTRLPAQSHRNNFKITGRNATSRDKSRQDDVWNADLREGLLSSKIVSLAPQHSFSVTHFSIGSRLFYSAANRRSPHSSSRRSAISSPKDATTDYSQYRRRTHSV